MTDPAAIARAQQFHGHMCPGLAMGIRAAEIALEHIGPHAGDEEVVAIVETDMCGVDGIQVLTGCTFGKGNLIHRDYGKNAYTFCRRSDGKAIRVLTKAQGWGEGDRVARAERILAAPIEDLYDVVEVSMAMPRMARFHASLACAECGEATMETRIRLFNGHQLCPPCFDAEMSGRHAMSAPRRMPADG